MRGAGRIHGGANSYTGDSDDLIFEIPGGGGGTHKYAAWGAATFEMKRELAFGTAGAAITLDWFGLSRISSD